MREKVKTDGLIQSLPIGISITTPKGKILDVNPTGFKMFGFKTKEEFMENPGQVYWPEQEERDKFFTLLKKGSVINFKVKGKHKDGSELWVSVNSTSKKNEIGEVHFINSFQEITKQKIIEEELHRYESIVSSSNDMIALLDKNYTYLASNNAYVKEFGLNEAEIIGKTVTKVFGKDFFETVIKPRAGKCLKEKKEVNYADWFIFPKSGKKYLNVTYSPYIGNDEILKGFVVIARDISDQRKAEDDLKLKNNAIESSLNAIAIINLDGKLTYVNPSFQKMWKYGNEIHGEPIIKFWKEKGKTVDMIDLVIKNGSWKGELVAEKKDGKLFNVELSANLVRDNDDKPICMMASFVDITDQRNAELEVVRTNENLQNVIDSASEIIISFDNKFNVKTWNKTAEIITGYKKREIVKKSISKLNVFIKPNEIENYIKHISQGHKIEHDEIGLRSKNGAKKILKISGSTIKNIKDEDLGVLFIGKDITFERESHGKLLRGNSYLISNKNNDVAKNLFIDLTNSWHNGLYITRSSPELIQTNIPQTHIKTILLNQDKLKDFDNISDINGVIDAIKDFSINNENSVILLDRVDYLLTRFSFEEFIEALYQINNIVSTTNSILLTYLNPAFLNNREMAFINAELQSLPSQKIEGVEIKDELFNILKFIDDENQNNLLVSFKKISKEFFIVKSTTAKRLKALEDEDLIYVKKQGRSKTVHISDKGKTLLQDK